MSRYLALCLILVLFSPKAFPQKALPVRQLPEICLTQTEIELYRLINEYRAQKGLPGIKVSASLCFVARSHAKDQTENFKVGKRCNMHSWSNKGEWSSCCYTPDHKKAKCMWDKPRELTNYQGNGYEISFFSSYIYSSPTVFATAILDGWKKSPSHNNVIMNKNIWKNIDWQAIGIGIYGNYADVWFGQEEDSARGLQPCDKE